MRTHARIPIDAPADAIWSVMTDVHRWPEWTASISAVESLQDGPLQVGNRYRVRQPRLPQAVWTVTELIPGRSFTWINRSPGLTSTGIHRIDSAADGTLIGELVLHQAGALSFLARPFARLTSRYVEMEAAGLKATSEAASAGA